MAFLEKFGRRSRLQTENSELNSILTNLNNILNTRKEYGSILRDFGIRDMNEYVSCDHIALAVIEEVKANIAKYEPRVELVSMTRVDDKNPLRLSFQIECRVQETKQSLRMVLDTVNSSVNLRSP